jgi:trehalose 6-phosphate synthase
MPQSERVRRFERLYGTIAASDIGWWTSRYLAALTGADSDDGLVPPEPPRRTNRTRQAAAGPNATSRPTTKKTTAKPAKKPAPAANDAVMSEVRAGFRQEDGAKLLPNTASPR